MAESYAELRALNDAELIHQYDRTAPSTSMGLGFLREELARREANRQTVEITRMTKQMRDMTIAITAMTAVVLLLTCVNVYLVLPA